jgi:hypothetical protein
MKNQISRSKTYPGINLSVAFEKIQSISKKLGSSSYYNKEDIAVGMGYRSSNNGTFLRSIAALSQYGLIEKQGNKYSFTTITNKILYPTVNEDRFAGIRDAALKPILFFQIYDTYKGQELPELLPNILMNTFGILPSVKERVASIFHSTMEYAGLIDGNKLRVVNAVSEDSKNINVSDSISVSDEKMKMSSNPNVVFNSIDKDFGKGRNVKISMPSDISSEERKKIITLIENL